MSLRARVLVGMAVIAVVLAMAAIVITRTTERELVGRVDGQLAATVAVREDRPRFAGLGPPSGERSDGGEGGGADDRLTPFYEGVVNADGEVETRIAPNVDDAPLPEVDGAEAVAAAASGEAFTVGAAGSESRYRVMAGTESSSGDTFVVAVSLDDVDATVRRLIAVEAGVTLAVLAVVSLVSWWVVHLGVRPVKRMTTTASAIAGGDLARRVPEGKPGTEAGELGVALNRMLGRIEESFDQQARSEERLRQFVADASHELRTPVATIRGYCELYASGGLEQRSELAEAMRRAGQESVRMGRLVDDLLLLARLDQGRPQARDPVDVAALANDAARDARAVAPRRTVGFDGPLGLVVLGDVDRLRQVLANVVGNALVHTPATAPIEVRASRVGDEAVIEVADGGDGMAPDVAARAFERFFRADAARARHRGGSGLGLAIVEATVLAHAGHVSLASAPGEGTTVRLAFPLAETPERPQP